MGQRAYVSALTLAISSGACSGSSYVPARTPELPPQVSVAVSSYRYDVAGRTVQQIAHSLYDGTPGLERLHAVALTRWRVAWTGRSTVHQGACRMVDLRVSVQVRAILPRWVDQGNGSSDARERWVRFERAVVAHEEGHRDIAFQAALALLQYLQGARSSCCLTLAEDVRSSVRLLLEEYRQTDRAYDRRTLRGRLQGVVWQP